MFTHRNTLYEALESTMLAYDAACDRTKKKF